MDKLLTIGMSTYDDYDGVFFTIQSIRMHHKLNFDEIEFILLDNNPDGLHSEANKKIMKSVNGKYIPYKDNNSSFVKYQIPKYSEGKYTLILDSHVLLNENSITSLLDYYKENPNCKNLIQGPLLHDSLKGIYTHFDPKWSSHMYGVWGFNKELYEKNLPFEIEMQGMGLFSFETEFFPEINKNFTGFGGEEWYISEKFRQNGGKNICLPSLKWLHRFDRPNGVKYKLSLEDRLWNYFIGWFELYKDPKHEKILELYNYFKENTKLDVKGLYKFMIKNEHLWI